MKFSETSLNERPILVVGTMRSGTTLINRILNAHSMIFMHYGQTDFLRHFYNKYNPIENINNVNKLLSDLRLHMLSYDKSLSDEQLNEIIKYVKLWGPSYKNIYKAIAVTRLLLSNQGRWGEKYAGTCQEVGPFFDMYSEGQVIHIIRDPRDVFVSNKKRIEELNPAAIEINDHLLILRDWLECYSSLQLNMKKYSSNKYFFLRYEDLITSPVKVTKKICDFLDLPWEEKMLDTEKYVDSYGNAWHANTFFDKEAIKGVSSVTIGRYKKLLKSAERAFIESKTARHIKNLGYSKISYFNIYMSRKEIIKYENKLQEVIDRWSVKNE